MQGIVKKGTNFTKDENVFVSFVIFCGNFGAHGATLPAFAYAAF